MGVDMTSNEVLDILSDRAWHRVASMPAFLLRGWGSPIGEPTENVIAHFVSPMEDRLVLPSIVISKVMDRIRRPYAPLRMPDFDESSPCPSIHTIDYGLRNYFAREALSAEMVHSVSPLLDSLKMDMTTMQYRLLHVFYMPLD